MKTKTTTTKKITTKIPAFGTPEWRKKYAGKKRSGKKPSWKKKMLGDMRSMSQIVTRMAKAQGIAVPKAVKGVKRTTRKTVRR